MRRIIDLTHPLFNGLEGFPGNPQVHIKSLHQIEDGGYNVSTFSMDGHTGTHIDVPKHVFPDGQSLDKLDLNKCIGSAICISIPKGKGDEIRSEELKPFEDQIRKIRRLILATGWSAKFGQSEFYCEFPGVSIEAASWLIERDVRLMGIEQPSVHHDKGLEVHRKLLEAGVVIVEALARPERIPSKVFELICLPLSIRSGDGGPARVVAVVLDK